MTEYLTPTVVLDDIMCEAALTVCGRLIRLRREEPAKARNTPPRD